VTYIGPPGSVRRSQANFFVAICAIAIVLIIALLFSKGIWTAIAGLGLFCLGVAAWAAMRPLER
jgi:uncharacterized membrane protein